MLLLIAIVLEMNKAWQLFRAESRQLFFCYANRRNFHPHTGTLSSKTNLFPHRQDYSCLSPAPASTWDDPNLSEHDRILSPKANYQSLLWLLHACKVSAFLYFHFLLPKVKDHQSPCKHFLCHLLPKTPNSILLLA